MTAKVPVHLICGYLGAGKTTLLGRLLAEQPAEEKLAVLVNEFGDLGIDGGLLEGFDSEVMEMASGCICCVLKADFMSSVTRILTNFSPQRIVVEATGLAEAGKLLIADRKGLVVVGAPDLDAARLFDHGKAFPV